MKKGIPHVTVLTRTQTNLYLVRAAQIQVEMRNTVVLEKMPGKQIHVVGKQRISRQVCNLRKSVLVTQAPETNLHSFYNRVARSSKRNTPINCQNHQKMSLLVEEQSIKLIHLMILVENSIPRLELKMMSLIQRVVETVSMS